VASRIYEKRDAEKRDAVRAARHSLGICAGNEQMHRKQIYNFSMPRTRLQNANAKFDTCANATPSS
jgi:hypothetical protein